MIGQVLFFSELDFGYDPIGSGRIGYENLDRQFLFLKLSSLLKNSVTSGYEYRIFGQEFTKKPSDVTLCLDNGEQLTFIVSVIERGRRHSISMHRNCYLALADFLFRALDEKPFYYLDIDPMIRYNDAEE